MSRFLADMVIHWHLSITKAINFSMMPLNIQWSTFCFNIGLLRPTILRTMGRPNPPKVIGHLSIKLVNDNWKNWDEHLPAILFSYKIAFKVSTGYKPFKLDYGFHSLMPTKYIVPTQRIDGTLDFIPTCVFTACLANLEQMDCTKYHA